jgi:hypothetical protein
MDYTPGLSETMGNITTWGGLFCTFFSTVGNINFVYWFFSLFGYDEHNHQDILYIIGSIVISILIGCIITLLIHIIIFRESSYYDTYDALQKDEDIHGKDKKRDPSSWLFVWYQLLDSHTSMILAGASLVTTTAGMMVPMKLHTPGQYIIALPVVLIFAIIIDYAALMGPVKGGHMKHNAAMLRRRDERILQAVLPTSVQVVPEFPAAVKGRPAPAASIPAGSAKPPLKQGTINIPGLGKATKVEDPAELEEMTTLFQPAGTNNRKP